MLRPLDEAFEKLLELKVVVIRNGKYLYAREFEESVKQLKLKPPGKLSQIRLARKIHKKIIPAMAKSAVAIDKSLKSFKGKKREIDLIITSYICLITHVKRLNIELPQDEADLSNIIYATYYMNDHAPTIQKEFELIG